MRVLVTDEELEEENAVRVMNDEVADSGDDEIPLQISVMSFNGLMVNSIDRLSSIKLPETIGEVPVLMLVDSGATQNFMSRRLAMDMGLHITEVPPRPIKLGDGFTAKTHGECLGVIIYVQGLSWEISTMLFDLDGIDVVLGVAWLTQIGVSWIDWIEKKMRFDYQSAWVEVQGVRGRECASLQLYVDDNRLAQLQCDSQEGVVSKSQQIEMQSVLRQQEHAIHLVKKQGPETDLSLEVLIVSMSFLTGIISDMLGRRPILITSSIMLLLSGWVMLWAPNVHVGLLSRLLGGVAIAFSMMLTLLNIFEMALPDIRGLLNALPQFSCFGGMFVAYIMDIIGTQFPSVSLEDKAVSHGASSDSAPTLVKSQKGKSVI